MTTRLLLVVLLLTTWLSAQDQTIPWQTDLAAARELAKTRKAPLFVVFRCEA